MYIVNSKSKSFYLVWIWFFNFGRVLFGDLKWFFEANEKKSKIKIHKKFKIMLSNDVFQNTWLYLKKSYVSYQERCASNYCSRKTRTNTVSFNIVIRLNSSWKLIFDVKDFKLIASWLLFFLLRKCTYIYYFYFCYESI